MHIINPKEKLIIQNIGIYIFLFGLFLIIFSETTLRFISNKLIYNLNMVTIPIIFL